MAKLLKLRRGTTSQHSSFTGAEGEVTVDTDKETLVVHDGSTQAGFPLAAEDLTNVSSATIAGRLSADSIATSKIAAGALPTDVTVASANIVNGTIVNEDVNASAAIAGTKISPDFGSQNTTTTGISAVGELQVTSTAPKILFTDSDSNPDFEIRDLNGTLNFRDTTNDVVRLAINSDGHVDVAGNLDVGAGIDVTGDTTVTGSVVVGSGGSTVSDAGLVVSADDAGAAVFLQRSGSGRFDCSVANESGSLVFRGGSDSSTVAGLTNRMSIHGSTGNVTVAQNLDVGAGVDVTGNITVTGTVDGVDVATRDTLFGGLTSSSGVLTNGVTATTQSASDNTTKVATTAYVTTAIGNADAFPSGTVMLFAQSSAPTGWTKQTTHNNKALRVVSGSASSGGSNAFSNTFASRSLTANAGNTTAGGNVSVSIANANTSGNVNSHTLSINEIPSHSHGIGAASLGPPNGGSAARGASAANIGNMSTGNAGGGGGHSHGFSGGSHSHNANASFSGSAHNHNISVTNLDLEVQFVDVILAAKD